MLLFKLQRTIRLKKNINNFTYKVCKEAFASKSRLGQHERQRYAELKLKSNFGTPEGATGDEIYLVQGSDITNGP